MKRTPLRRKAPLTAKTRMKQVSDKKRQRRASAEGQAALAYLSAVKQLPCVVCGSPGPNDAHHCQSGRFSKARSSDFDTIPLCPRHHRQEYGPGAYHYSKRAWEDTHGPDTDYIGQTQMAILGYIK